MNPDTPDTPDTSGEPDTPEADWVPLLFREDVLRVLLNIDDPGATGYPDPYVHRVTVQLQEAGLLDTDGELTERGRQVRNGVTDMMSEERDELDDLRARAEEGVSVVERGKIIRKLSALERTADDEDRARIEDIKDVLGV